MKKVSVCMLLLCTCTYSDCPDLIRNYLIENAGIYEPNPSHKEESEEIESLYEKILTNITEYDSTNTAGILDSLFSLFHRNSSGLYEDSFDSRRMRIRRSYILQMMAMVSDDFSYVTYLKMAKYCLYSEKKRANNKIICEIDDLLKEEFIKTQFLSLYLDSRFIQNSRLLSEKLESISEYYKKNRNDLPDSSQKAIDSLLSKLNSCSE